MSDDDAYDNYPRPQMRRETWRDLSGSWSFAFDDEDRGRDGDWRLGFDEQHTIQVPFPPESPASGVGDCRMHAVGWYSRYLTSADVEAVRPFENGRLLLHFGAVDYRADVWLDGTYLGSHEGGHTPFSFDIAQHVRDGDRWLLVVRAEDDPQDAGKPRGKQDWQDTPHSIWYERTTGIWQPVWLEGTPSIAFASVQWTPDPTCSSVSMEGILNRVPLKGTRVKVVLELDGKLIASAETSVSRDRFTVLLPIADQDNGQAHELILWSPDSPTLLDARVELIGPESLGDVIESYVGLRNVRTERGRFLLNYRPYFIRAVLGQGYWRESHLSVPSAEALRDEVQLIKNLGFNTVRLHQKFEDPRFLGWADRLGLLVWSEAPGAYEFSPTAVARTTREWVEVLDRDRSHPCIVTWVPLNESWGVQHVAQSPAMQAYVRAITDLTRAIDPTRPVISNDGWEHANSDIITVHDYEWRSDVVEHRYSSPDARKLLLEGIGPAGRRILLDGVADEGQPLMLTEFGGIRFSQADEESAWGYSTASSIEDFKRRLTDLVSAVKKSDLLSGFCYTQLADTAQEQNGLVSEDRVPKLPIEELRALFSE